MSEVIALEIKGLSKCFELRKKKAKGFLSLQRFEAVRDLARGRSVRKKKSSSQLWALRDIDIQVKKGEIIGIIGRNGAGKSTLLKILARIYRPTKGTAKIRGRTASLLEMGLGFDREMTVRENIIMNSIMNNVSQKDVEAQIERIAAFAKLEEHLDTSLHHCPSGSYIKLAFSAAINMDADVILADEVLAVGDISFQSECISHIKRLSGQGQSVLFVSHDMSVIRDLCDRVIWIDKGVIVKQGDPDEVVDSYIVSLLGQGAIDGKKKEQAITMASSLDGAIEYMHLVSPEGEQMGALDMGAPGMIEIMVRAGTAVEEFRVHAACFSDKQIVFSVSQPMQTVQPDKEYYKVRLHLPEHFLNEFPYVCEGVLELFGKGQSRVLEAKDPLQFTVYNTNAENSAWGDWPWGRPGFITPKLEWKWKVSQNFDKGKN